LPAGQILAALDVMGAKYLPTKRDLKANQRFHQKKNPLPQTKISGGGRSAKKRK
jgi:hypothetical protein